MYLGFRVNPTPQTRLWGLNFCATISALDPKSAALVSPMRLRMEDGTVHGNAFGAIRVIVRGTFYRAYRGYTWDT